MDGFRKQTERERVRFLTIHRRTVITLKPEGIIKNNLPLSKCQKEEVFIEHGFFSFFKLNLSG